MEKERKKGRRKGRREERRYRGKEEGRKTRERRPSLSLPVLILSCCQSKGHGGPCPYSQDKFVSINSVLFSFPVWPPAQSPYIGLRREFRARPSKSVSQLPWKTGKDLDERGARNSRRVFSEGAGRQEQRTQLPLNLSWRMFVGKSQSLIRIGFRLR